MVEHSKKRLVYVCSPLKGEESKNIAAAKLQCRHLMLNDPDVIAFAPHVYFTSFLVDDVESERNLGINGGMHMLELCDEMAVFCDDGTQQTPLGLTEGMLKEIYFAENVLGMKITYYSRETMSELPNE